MCPYGFAGNLCEKEEKIICRPGKCHNGGICQADGAVAKCKCAYGFTGHECEEKINIEQFFDKESMAFELVSFATLISLIFRLLRSICEKNRCWERANDGNCDAECNLAVCNFDGGDCSGKQEPFSRCKYGNLCADYFANGKCDQACNNEDCLYDGMDCLPAVVRCPVKIREHCAARFANGICDTECNTDGCGFDGGDCAVQKNTTVLTNIRIKIQMEPREFQATGGQTLMEISSALRAAVRIQKDEEGPLVFEWMGDKETNRVEMDVAKLTEQHVLSKSLVRRVRNVGDKGVVVYLEVQEDCITGKCLYTDSQSVVDIISARLAKQGTITFGAPISEAIVAAPRRPSGSSGSLWNQIIIILGGFCAMGIASIGVLTLRDNRSRKRKMISAPVWMPPMEHEEKNRRHHQSINSSQHSLLDTNGYYDPKRNRGDYNPNGQYQQFYPVAYGNGYDYQVQKTATTETENLPENILLHLQAAGNEDITEPITKETVNLQDSKYNRTVLHWLAGNTNGKAEDRIVVEVEKCIKAGADVNALDSDENTPLMLAVKSRRVKLAVILMRAGADPTIYNKSERSALHEAAVNKDLMMMRRLLTDKRLLRDIDELDRNGLTVLMEVARSEGDYQVEMAKLLLSKGAKIDSDGASRKDSEIYRGRTALHYAALVDNLPMVEYLVSQNANKDKQDEAGQTPIMLAAKEGHERVVMMLIACGASVVAVDALDHSARQLAKFRNHHNIVDIFNHFQPQTLEGSPGELPVLQQHLPHQLTVLSSSSSVSAPPRKNARQNCKGVNVKKQNSKKKETNSRDSTHLTPPPSDGSTSSPSPQHFMSMTHTTPTSVHYMSPEYQGDVGSSDA
uniref:Uncharacterized protein n=1 Tax=Caenorhabditis japonica TaxID=281687 RepID=A0A8R1E9Z4_CAEJA